MVVMNKCIIVMYPGGGCLPIKPPIPGPRPMPLYGVVKPLYAVPVK
jgi:hypothetical protein